MFHRYDPNAYEIGSDIYIAERDGWSGARVSKYCVKRKTATGIITAERGKSSLRIGKRGAVVGDTGYRKRYVVNASDAKDIIREMAERGMWASFRNMAADLDKAARNNDEDALFSVASQIAQAIEARRAETQGGSVHESAVAEGHAPHPNQDTPHE